MTLRSYVARHQPERRPDPDELTQLRRDAWHRQGLVVLHPVDIPDDWTRQVIINEASRQYGRREDRR